MRLARVDRPLAVRRRKKALGARLNKAGRRPYIAAAAGFGDDPVNADERNILQAFLADLSRAPDISKDAEADAMIQAAVRSNPNALYLLVQHAILSDQALHAAQAQLVAQGGGQSGGSFLPQSPPSYQPQSPSYQNSSPWAGQGGAPVQSSPFGQNSGLGGFLRQAGQMAAGVAAGDFLFEGIENIFGRGDRW
jgi:uncharacterized protein